MRHNDGGGGGRGSGNGGGRRPHAPHGPGPQIWLWQHIHDRLLLQFRADPRVRELIPRVEAEVWETPVAVCREWRGSSPNAGAYGRGARSPRTRLHRAWALTACWTACLGCRRPDHRLERSPCVGRVLRINLPVVPAVVSE